ncbi:hypothetical protein Loa_02426 [Legionella oakridgensis ATCC 33761 = DSM 21215]|uniref:Uncharacterized protein n=1 Tax=Legionella oakridgensis ATCC 33761 = DSM 21215 TaxID=1268635 RepID=W0BBR1_9GAMM|nr:hypothetical protein Loa_02426 [Legionella oakridgensis ATCC 33761 = DSM 21215]
MANLMTSLSISSLYPIYLCKYNNNELKPYAIVYLTDELADYNYYHNRNTLE